MLDCLKFRKELKKLTAAKVKALEFYSDKIKKVRQETKSHDEIQEILHTEMFEVGIIQEEIDMLITSHLRAKANHLLVPIPECDDENMWTECNKISRQKVLTTRGINSLKSAIRKEKKERLELPITLAMLLIGIIGAITGLIAISKS